MNEAAYSGKKLSTNVKVPGRLKKDPGFANFYEDVLHADPEVIATVREGYYFPFEIQPPECRFTKNNRSCMDKQEFAWAELQRLEKLGCVERVEGPSFLELPLSVVFSNKWRLVVDASRHLNPFLKKRKIKRF